MLHLSIYFNLFVEKLSPEEKVLKDSFDNFEDLQSSILHTLEYWDKRKAFLTKVCICFNFFVDNNNYFFQIIIVIVRCKITYQIAFYTLQDLPQTSSSSKSKSAVKKQSRASSKASAKLKGRKTPNAPSKTVVPTINTILTPTTEDANKRQEIGNVLTFLKVYLLLLPHAHRLLEK